MQISVFTDGGSRGNPGHSGFGVAIYNQSKQPIVQISKYIGIKTNNEAEYLALIAALTWIKDHQSAYTGADIFSDSQLLVRQVLKKYRVKAANIKPLYQQVTALLSAIHIPLTFTEIYREKNELADSLANQAMDQK